MKGYRQGRLGEEIRKVISGLLLREIQDPRLSGLVSVSAVDVTSDGSFATVYVSVLGEADGEWAAENQQKALEAFKGAKGLIRREIGKQIKLRHVPDLIFKIDNSMEYGRHISRIIEGLGLSSEAENDAMSEIAARLLEAQDILIFPHIVADGDAVGSSVALCRALRLLGKDAYVLVEDAIPSNLLFLDAGHVEGETPLSAPQPDESGRPAPMFVQLDQGEAVIGEPDVCVCIDCADVARFPLREELFFRGKVTMCLDHHKTNKRFADYNHIDAGAAATGEIIYKLLLEMQAPITKEIGEALYAAITTDTGNFQYNNTSAESHLITAALFERGIDRLHVSRMLYQGLRMEKLHLFGEILKTVRMVAGGQAAVAYATLDMLAELGAQIEDTEGWSETLRNIKGVEVGVFAKEVKPGETMISMRSKVWADVSQIAATHEGGGHKHAAGCVIYAPPQEALRLVEADVEAYFLRVGPLHNIFIETT